MDPQEKNEGGFDWDMSHHHTIYVLVHNMMHNILYTRKMQSIVGERERTLKKIHVETFRTIYGIRSDDNIYIIYRHHGQAARLRGSLRSPIMRKIIL